jgi:uncharacterized damage-inducible protein DinB
MTEVLQVPDTRHGPSPDLDEREMLIAFLDNYRETVLIKLDGLSREALVQRVASSRTTLLGIVKHLIHVEERWFDAAIGGAPMRTRNPDDRDAEWVVDEDETAEDLATRYRVMWARSNEIARAASLDDHRRRADRPETDLTVRWILVHMLEETARHAGHADILRELIDGRTGD